MPTTTRSSGVRVTVPDTLQVAREPSRRRGRRTPTTTTAQDEPLTRVTNDDIIGAFANRLRLVDAITVAPTGTPAQPDGTRRGPPDVVRGIQRAEFAIEVEPDEMAVVLVEQDGLYSWAQGEAAPARPARRGAPAKRQITFTVDVNPTSSAYHRRDRRGFIRDLILRPATAMVFKFVAGIAVGQVVKRFERDSAIGLIHIASPNPTEWTKPPNRRKLRLPTDRPARILLMVHGTFSTTRAGFGGLGATPKGRDLLTSAIDKYDAVLGFDHRTLSEDPLDNAEHIAQALAELDKGHGFLIDAVAHSRGALVTRSLIEHVLPTSALDAKVGKAILVAGTNGGTALADPENWKVLLDLHTNLVVAGCRAVAAAAPPVALVSTILAEAFEAITAFVKALAVTVIDEGKVPGLAAMKPGGSFVTEINTTQPGQPDPSILDYFVIKSDFEIEGLDGPQEFPTKLKRAIQDELVDSLMNKPNDLVVDVPSMSVIDPDVPGFLRDELDFKTNNCVYHSNYFVQQAAIRSLGRWLKLDRDRMRGVATDMLGGEAVDLPAVVDDDIAVFDAQLSALRAVDALQRSDATYAVVRRFHDTHRIAYHYAFRTDEFIGTFGGTEPRTSIEETGVLHESDRAPESAPGDVVGFSNSQGGQPWSRRMVVLDQGKPVGVVPHADEMMAAANGGGTSPPRSRGPRRRQQDGFAGRSAEPTTAETYFRAEMDNEIGINTEASVLVDISREELLATDRAGAGAGAATVSLTRQITIHVIPRVNMKVVDDKQVTIDPPAPNRPTSLIFTVAGTNEGPGELAIVAEQGPVVLVKLVLRPTISAAPQPNGRRATATADVPAPPTALPRHELFIEENKVIDSITTGGNQQQVVTQTVFDVRFRSKRLDVIARDTTKAIKGDRLGYVKAMFKEIEDRWVQSAEDTKAFTQQLRAYGGQLFDELVPAKIQAILWDNRDSIETIQVFSADPFIPWELVHLKKPNGKLPAEERFLANMGLVRWLDGAAWPPDQIKVRNGQAIGVVPEYPDGSGWELKEPAYEYKYVDDTFGATKAKTTVNDLISLIETPGQFDLLHFAGHGLAIQDDIANAGIVLDVRRENGDWKPVSLTSTIVEQFCHVREEGGNRPLVFLNACQVGRAGYKLTGIGGFSQAFLRGGAGVFVSSLWAVGDEPARTFTEQFYAELKKGKTLAKATTAARKKARKADDATWLAYVVYGDPHAKIVSGRRRTET